MERRTLAQSPSCKSGPRRAARDTRFGANRKWRRNPLRRLDSESKTASPSAAQSSRRGPGRRCSSKSARRSSSTPCSAIRSPGIPTGSAVLKRHARRLVDRRLEGIEGRLVDRAVAFDLPPRGVPELLAARVRAARPLPKRVGAAADRLVSFVHWPLPTPAVHAA